MRLIECHRVLKDTGSIYLHCDWHANSYLRMLMDAIFGSENFRNEVIWSYRRWAGKARKYQSMHDSLLFYAKDAGSEYAWNWPMEPKAASTPKHKRWNEVDPITGRVVTKSDPTVAVTETNMRDVWEISRLHSNSRERVGYSTQKPLALYQRIIRASSNPGDTVLDLFAGCATTVVAAELEGRNWLACDWAYRASTMMMRRFYQNDIELSSMNVDVVRDALGPHTGKLEYKIGRIIGPPDLARFPRQTEDPDDGVPTLKTSIRAPISTSWTGRIPKDSAKEMLLAEFGPVCWGCGLDATRPNGSVDTGLLEVDHIRARNAKEGTRGDDELYNLALLHATCNRRKGNRLTLEELRLENEQDDVLNVSSRLDFVGFFEAQQFAHRMLTNYG